MNQRKLSTQTDRLPVAPEFAETLQENAYDTAKAVLKAIHAPAEVLALVKGISDLSYYLVESKKDPAQFTEKDRNARFEIEEVVLETVNAIAACGGCFTGGGGITYPRKGTILAENEGTQ